MKTPANSYFYLLQNYLRGKRRTFFLCFLLKRPLLFVAYFDKTLFEVPKMSYNKGNIRGHPLSTYANFSVKLTILISWYAHVRVRIKGLEMLVFRDILRTYLMDDPLFYINRTLQCHRDLVTRTCTGVFQEFEKSCLLFQCVYDTVKK